MATEVLDKVPEETKVNFNFSLHGFPDKKKIL
jgi:hypothetical protein